MTIIDKNADFLYKSDNQKRFGIIYETFLDDNYTVENKENKFNK